MSTTNFLDLSEITKVKILQFLSTTDTLECRLVSKEFFPRDLTLSVTVGERGVNAGVRLNLAQKKETELDPDKPPPYIEASHSLRHLTDIPDFLLAKTKILCLFSSLLGSEEMTPLARNCKQISRLKLWFLNPEAISFMPALLRANQSSLKVLCVMKAFGSMEDKDGNPVIEWDYSDPIDVRVLAPMEKLAILTNHGNNMCYIETLPRSLTSLTIRFPGPGELLKWLPSEMVNLKYLGVGPINLKSGADFDLDTYKKICNDMKKLEQLLVDFQVQDKVAIYPTVNTLFMIQHLCRETKGIKTTLTIEEASFHVRTAIARPQFGGL